MNVTITAPKNLVNGVEATFTCSSICYPSCTYDWLIGDKTWKKVGNVLRYTPPAETKSATVTCKAQNILSGLFVISTITVPVARKYPISICNQQLHNNNNNNNNDNNNRAIYVISEE